MKINHWLDQLRTSFSRTRRNRKTPQQVRNNNVPAEMLESRLLLTPLNLSLLSSAQRIQSNSWSFGNEDTAATNDDFIADVNGSSTGSGFDGGRLTLEAGDDLTVNSGVNLHGNLELELNVDFYGSRGFVFPAPVDPDPGVGGTLTLNGTVTGSGITLFGHTDNDVFDISSEAINGSSSFTIDGWEGNDTANLNVTGATGVTLTRNNSNSTLTYTRSGGGGRTITIENIENINVSGATPTVVDNDDPDWDPARPSSITVNQNTATGADLNNTELLLALEGFATDIDDASLDFTANPATFPIGTTSVTFTATDDAGNTADATFDVTVTEQILTVEIVEDSIAENAGFDAANATVTRTGSTGDLVVTLTSNDESEGKTFPTPTVTIADGQTSASFTIDAINDDLIDGTQTVTITASAPGFTSGSDTIDVTDDDVPALTLSIAADSFSEGAGVAATTATVTRNTGTTGDLTVNLASDDTSELIVPATVMIPDGDDSVTFDIAAVDDAIIDGAQNVTITATATGFTESQDSVLVGDDDAILVSTTSDVDDDNLEFGQLSLREAVRLANADPDVSEIRFDESIRGATIFLTNGQLELTESVNIIGPRAAVDLIVDAQGSSRVFAIEADVDLDSVTVKGGSSTDNGGGILLAPGADLTVRDAEISGNTGRQGGGIYLIEATLSIEDSLIAFNTATNEGNNGGGGIYAEDSMVSIAGSSIVSNEALTGSGGGAAFPLTSLNVSNSTISDNTSTVGAGLSITLSANANIRHTTIANNTGDHSALHVNGAATVLNASHVLVGDNTNTSTEAGDFADVGGNSPLMSFGHSLIEEGNTTFGGTNIEGQDPLIGALGTNGSELPTHPLLPGSPALDAGETTSPDATDQRGFVRVLDGDGDGTANADIGAVEASTAIPATLQVSTDTDIVDGDYSAGELSLREAINIANDRAGADQITFDAALSGSTILLTGGQLELTDDATITGPGTADELIVDAQQQSRVFRIDTDVTATLTSLTVTNGDADENVERAFSGSIGGGILNAAGTLTLENVTVSNSFARWGGGINNYGDGGTATINLLNSTVSENTSRSNAAGLYNWGDNGTAVANIDGTTFSGNDAEGQGGAIYNWRGTATLRLQNSSILNNTAAASFGGGIRNDDGIVEVVNSTIAGNVAAVAGPGIHADTVGRVTINNTLIAGNRLADGTPSAISSNVAAVSANNLIDDAASSGGLTNDDDGDPTTGGNNIVGVDWKTVLANDGTDPTLADNGGTTQTVALLPNSPAIDAGDNALAVDADSNPLTTDQRGDGFARILDGDNDSTATVDIGAVEYPEITTLRVTNFASSDSGFTAEFSAALDAELLNLTDSSSGQLGPADITLVGASTGAVRGSVLVNSAMTHIEFVSATGALPPDDYTVTFRSADNGFADAEGELLDGNADGTPGDNYVDTFTIDARPADEVTVSLPSFTRGAGQDVNLPRNTDAGIPLTISTGVDVTGVDLDVAFNPDLLDITGFTSNISGASSAFNLVAAGLIRITISSANDFATSGGEIELGRFTATVPNTANYAGKHILDIRNLNVENSVPETRPSRAEDGLHVSAYVGDASGNGFYSSGDTTLLQRVIVGSGTGATAFQNADPLQFLDLNNSGTITSGDATLLQRIIVGIDVSQAPPPPTGVTPPAPTGADPRLEIPQDLTGAPGDVVTVPVNMTVTETDGITVSGMDLAIQFDETRFTAGNVRVGSLLGSGFSVVSNTDTAGVLRVTLSQATGPSLAFNDSGPVLEFDLTILGDAADGASSINLLQNFQTTVTAVSDNDVNELTLVPAPTNADNDTNDGIITVATPDTTAPTLAITPNSGTTSDSPITFTFEFSEDVSGFESGDVTLTNGTAGTFTAVDGNTYTLDVTPDADGDVTASVAAGAAADAAANDSEAATATVSSDTTDATLTITPNSGSTGDNPIVFTFEFSEDVTGFEAGDITLSNGTPGTFTVVDGNTYTLEVAPSLPGDVIVSAGADAAADAAGNGSEAGSATVTSTIPRPTSSLSIPLDLTGAPDDVVTVPVNLTVTQTDGISVSGMDIAIQFDETRFTAGNVQVGSLLGDGFSLTANTDTAGILRVTLSKATGPELALDASGPVITFDLMILGSAADGESPINILQSFQTTVTSVSDNDVNEITLVSPPTDGTDVGDGKISVNSDTTAPTVAITPNSGGTSDSPITFTFEFSEDVTGFEAGDVTLTNGTAGTFTEVDANTYTLEVTPDAEGDVTASVAADSAEDAASNGNTAGTATVNFDTTDPTVAVTPNSGTTSDSPIVFTIEFSEDVTGFNGPDVTNGTAGAFTAVDGNTYTVEVTPDADGDVTVTVPVNFAVDAAGNPNAAGSGTVTFDSGAPTLAITPDSGSTSDSPITFTFEFSEDVTGFDVSDVTLTNGTAGTFAAVDGNTYTLEVTPTADGDVTASVAAGAAADATANDSEAASATVSSDTTGPTVAITPNSGTTADNPIVFTFEFSEDVTGFEADDITLTNGTAGTFTAVDENTYTLDVVPDANGDVTASVAADAAADAAGNGNEAGSATVESDIPRAVSTLSIPLDLIGPPGAVVNVPVNLTVTQTAGISVSGMDIAIQFDETRFTADNVQVGSLLGDGFSLTANTDTAGILRVTLSKATGPELALDASGPVITFDLTILGSAADGASAINILQSFQTTVTSVSDNDVNQITLVEPPTDGSDAGDGIITVNSDVTAPTLAIAPNNSATSANPIVFTFEFSEDVTGFEADDVSLTNGTAGAFTAVDGNTYTLEVTPTADGDVTASVAAGAAADAATNDSEAASATVDYIADTTAPTLAITPDSGSTSDSPIVFTFEFSESVTGFEAADVTLTNGTAGTFTAVDSNTYTLEVTPDADGDVTASVAADAAVDVGGNNSEAASATVASDTTAPTLTITPNSGSTTDDPIEFRFQFSENVTGFEQSDVTITNGTGRTFTPADGDTFTLTVVPQTAGDVTVTVAAGSVTDEAGNAVAEASATVASTVDPASVAPTLDDAPDFTDEVQPTLDWGEVDGVTSYEIWFARVTPNESRLFTAGSVVTDANWAPPSDLDPAHYRYWVRTVGTDGARGPWSAPQDFDVRPTLTGPLSPTFEARPAFTWEAIPDATGYQIFIRTQDPSVGVNGDIVVSDIPAGTTSYTPTVDLPGGTIRWWIRATDSRGNRGWSDVGITGNRTAVTSADNSQITWHAVTGAGRYVLHVEDGSGAVVVREDQLTDTSLALSTLAAGNYRAWVKAIDGETNLFATGFWSRGFNFTVAEVDSDGQEQESTFDSFNLDPLSEDAVAEPAIADPVVEIASVRRENGRVANTQAATSQTGERSAETRFSTEEADDAFGLVDLLMADHMELADALMKTQA